MFICGGSCGDIASAKIVQAYSLDREAWTELPPAPQYYSEAAALDNKLILIGGADAMSDAITNMVSSWTGQVWEQNIPPMPTKRARPGVMTYSNYVLVAGGKAEDDLTILSSIDALDIATRQWWTPANLQLPRPMYVVSMTVCATHIYVASAVIAYDANTDGHTTSNSVWQLPVSTLNEVLTKEELSPLQWAEIASTLYFSSGLLQHTAHPLAVGGRDDLYRPTPNIAVFDPPSNKWSTVGQLLEPRVRCAVVSLSGDTFMVCGGCSHTRNLQSSLLNTVELVHME